MRLLLASKGKRPAKGYALLDVILAVSIFAIAATGLVGIMQKIGETSAAFSQDRMIQQGLISLLTETKARPVAEMNTEVFDEVMNVTWKSEVEELNLSTEEGEPIEDMYTLTVSATFIDAGGEQVESAQLYIYQPEQR